MRLLFSKQGYYVVTNVIIFLICYQLQFTGIVLGHLMVTLIVSWLYCWPQYWMTLIGRWLYYWGDLNCEVVVLLDDLNWEVIVLLGDLNWEVVVLLGVYSACCLY